MSPEEPATERTASLRPSPPGEDAGRYTPPVDWFAPVLHSQLDVVGAGAHARVVAMTDQAVGLIPLDPGLHQPRRSLFKTDVDLYLAELPPPDEAHLVVEWPDEGIDETRTLIDTAALHAAAARALEVWPGLEPPEPAGQPGSFATDWARVSYGDWGDARVIRARLDGGAPPDARIEGHGRPRCTWRRSAGRRKRSPRSFPTVRSPTRTTKTNTPRCGTPPAP